MERLTQAAGANRHLLSERCRMKSADAARICGMGAAIIPG